MTTISCFLTILYQLSNTLSHVCFEKMFKRWRDTRDSCFLTAADFSLVAVGFMVGRKASCLHDAFRSTATCRGLHLLHPLFSSFKESRLAGKYHVLHDAFRSTATCRGSSVFTLLHLLLHPFLHPITTNGYLKFHEFTIDILILVIFSKLVVLPCNKV